MQSAIKQFFWLIGLAAPLVAGGCAMFNDDRQALRDYEATRREMSGRVRGDVAQVDYEAEEEKETSVFAGLDPRNVANNIKKLTGRAPDANLAEGLFGQAEEKYRQALAAAGDQRKALFAEAGDAYVQAAARWPESALEQNALFMSGECYFFADRYPQANTQFELLLKKYPNARQLDTVEARRFAMAQYWLGTNRSNPQSFFTVNISDQTRPWRDSFGNAVRVFDKIRIDDPTGRLADDATLAAANAYFVKGDYVRADEFYTDLRKTFPSSEHQFEAHFLGLQCKLKTYPGPAYDGAALNEAERLIETIRKQFPQESDTEREYLTRAWREVRYKKAEREWVLAQYYDRRREYGGARFHYNAIVKDFDDTPFAEQARERIGAIAGEPNTPPQQLSWLVDLVNLVPSGADSKPLLLSNEIPLQR